MDSVTQLQDPAVRRAEARVGQVLRGKWRLDRLLGVGGFGAAFASTGRTGKRVAIKLLHPELSVDPQMRERFLREGRAANHVDHPGAVSVLDDDVAEDGSIFLVMELLDGESVEQRRERCGGRLDVVEVLSIVDQVLDVLAAAHAKGIVHRDLKDANLFVCRDGSVRVLDFGIARFREAGSAKGTHTGVSMGTPAFMAPEQARGLWEEVDGRTDLWAIGATMWTCLTGHTVHDGRTINEQLLAAMTTRAPALHTVAPTVPPPVAMVVDRALAYERDARFQSALEMQHALRVAYESLRSAPMSTAPRLVVPDVALRPTLPAVQPASQRTAEPVSSGRTGGPVIRVDKGRPILALGAGAVAGIALTAGLTATALRSTAPGHEAPPSSGVASTVGIPESASAEVASAPATTSASPPAPPAPSSTTPPLAKDKPAQRTTGKATVPPSADPFEKRGK
jgi:serine/threonine-protein kinase